MSTQSASMPSVEAAVQQPLYPSEPSPKQEGGRAENAPSAHWCGRCVTRCVQAATDRMCFVFNQATRSVAETIDETFMLHSIFRKLDRHILPMIAQLRQIPADYFKSFYIAIRSMTGALNCMYITIDIGYYISKGYKQDAMIDACAKACLTASDIGYGFLWLQELGINKLSNVFTGISNCRIFNLVPAIVENIPVLRSTPCVQQAAASIGNLRIFSFTTKITLNTFAQRAWGLAYLFFTAHSFQDLVYAIKAGESNRIRDATLKGLYHISELALESLLFFGYSNIASLGVLAIASTAFSVASLSYGLFRPEQNKAAI